MRTTLIILIVILFVLPKSFAQQEAESDLPKLLFHLPNKLGANFNFNLDDIEEYGLQVTFSGLTEEINTCSWSNPLGNISLNSDTLITEIDDITDFDAIVIQPATWWDGNAYADLLNNNEFLQLLKDAKENDLSIWATCAGVRVLAEADIIDGVNITGRDNYAAEYTNAGANYWGKDIMPVIDQNIITSTRGMYFHYENSEALIQDLESKAKSKPIRKKNSIKSHFKNPKNSNVIWESTIGGISSDGGKDIIQLIDGSFVISGYTWSSGNGCSDMMLVKVNQSGELIWSKTFGGNGWEYAYSVIELAQGGFVLAGYTTSEGEGKKDFYVVKTDAEGNEIWAKTFGGSKQDIAKDIIETKDGNLLLVGYTESFNSAENNFYVLKLDQEGNEIWSKTFGGSEAEMGRKVIENHNNEYLFLGSTGSYGAGNRDIYLICTDEAGNELWTQTYGDNSYNCGFDMIEINNNGYAIVGHTDVHGTELLDVFYVRTDSMGNQINSKRFESEYKFYDYGKSIFQTSQGYLAIGGVTKTKASRANDIYFMIIDENADLLWEEVIGGEGSEWSTAMCETKDGNFAMIGQTNSDGDGKFDAYLVKLQNPYVSINSIKPTDTRLLPIIPNPASYYANLNLVVANNETAQLNIYDNQGNSIKSISNINPGRHSLRWNCTDNNNNRLLAGIYHIVLKSNSTQTSKKLIIY